ncbi:MAG: NADH-quinone oxidoreductase subunit N [Candidatus Eremiobacteraeota bacterium]|nr:NADH-quinone oxidoreductase subunit N [Candidatus Eremiobacteraeota bacterium]
MTLQGVTISWPVLAPIVALTAGGLLIMLVDLVSRSAPRVVLYAIGLLSCIAAFVSMLGLYGHEQVTLGGAFASDRFSWMFDALLLVTLAVTFLLSSLRKSEDGGTGGAYAALLIFCTIGGMVMAGANNLIIIFLGIEQLSLALYVLAGTGFPREASQEAALKYVLLGSLASGFLIFGSALLYGSAGSISLAAIATAATAPSGLFVAGFALFLVGLAFKLALAPFHTWAPDVYEGSPLAITGFMAVAVKAAAFAVLARIVYVVVGHDSVALIPLWTLAILSMLVGNLGAIRQRNLKRLLGYSSIAQAGYIVVALAGVGQGGLTTMLFYLTAYALTTLGAFAVMALLGDGSDAYAQLDAYRGLFFRRPWPAAAMALFFFSLAGIPATAGFYGKILLLQQALASGPWGLAMAIALVFGTLVSFYVYGKVVWDMYASPEDEAALPTGNALAPWVAVAAGALGTVVFGVLPQIFYASQPFFTAVGK